MDFNYVEEGIQRQDINSFLRSLLTPEDFQFAMKLVQRFGRSADTSGFSRGSRAGRAVAVQRLTDLIMED